MAYDTAETRSAIIELAGKPPAGATSLCLERFRRVPGSEVPLMVLKELGDTLGKAIFGGDSDGPDHTRPGRTVSWRDPAGRVVAKIDVLPIHGNFEDALMPRLLEAAAKAGVRFELWCQVDGNTGRAVQWWDGRDLLGQPPPDSGYRESGGLTEGERSALDVVETRGFRVSRSATGASIVHEKREPPWPLWGKLLAVMGAVALWPFALYLFIRERHLVKEHWRRMSQGTLHRIEWKVERGLLTECVGGDGPPRSTEIPLADVMAVGFTPAAERISEDKHVADTLQIITRSKVHCLSRLDEPVGRALRELVRNSARRARA
jgi:hypothetical protein